MRWLAWLWAWVETVGMAQDEDEGGSAWVGDSHRAAQALAHMPRWVAVHECTLAKLDVVVAVAGSEGYDVDDMLADLDEARRERDRALGTRLDELGGQP